jgi:hypothetical protein
MRILLITLFLVPIFLLCQTVDVSGTTFRINHGDISFYLDADTSSLISVHFVTYSELTKIDGHRSDKWHKEWPGGPYQKNSLNKTGFDLGHLTPSNITSYDDKLNYHSFSLFNQAPQIAAFNRGKWAKLEKSVIKYLLKNKEDAVIITGVIYDKNAKRVKGTRVKIPTTFYKIVSTKSNTICYVGSNVNGVCVKTNLKTIIDLTKQSGTKVNIIINFKK